jgi:YjbE family integral membrane protein
LWGRASALPPGFCPACRAKRTIGHMTPFILNALRIVLIDVLLAGDNAVVIAMAVKSLPLAQRRTGTIAGAAGAIVLRIFITFFAFRILELPLFKFAGGLLILWIAIRLLIQNDDGPEKESPARSLRQAVWMILVADLTMSTDNILAVAAASNGSLPVLIAGLALSISFVMFMSGLLSRLMDRYPLIVWAGAAILGQIAGEMIATDPWVVAWLNRRSWPANQVEWGAEIVLAVLVPVTSLIIKKIRKKTGGRRVS